MTKTYQQRDPLGIRDQAVADLAQAEADCQRLTEHAQALQARIDAAVVIAQRHLDLNVNSHGRFLAKKILEALK